MAMETKLKGTIIQGDSERKATKAIVDWVAKAWAAKQRAEEAKKEWDQANKKLIETLGPGAVVVVQGLCRATIADRKSITIDDDDFLRTVLGDRFDDLVEEQVKYKPLDKLLSIANDENHELYELVREALTEKVTTTVTLRAAAAA